MAEADFCQFFLGSKNESPFKSIGQGSYNNQITESVDKIAIFFTYEVIIWKNVFVSAWSIRKYDQLVLFS